MDTLLDLFHKLRDVKGLVAWGGYVGLTAIIFAETGLFVGFFLPGDSLLVTAGLLASQPQFGLNPWLLGSILCVASIAGNALGYAIGRYSGPRLFKREESLFFKPRYLRQAHEFYERHGGKTVIIARFMPIVRTFVPIVAGAAKMDHGRYTTYNVVGGVLWIWSMILTGYFLGRYIPGIDRHIEKVIIVVIALSLMPGVYHWWQSRRRAMTADRSNL
ncbi:MAG: VTT domain-containing protein [Gemmatimonadota bacterium]